jgi:hypothetical protein
MVCTIRAALPSATSLTASAAESDEGGGEPTSVQTIYSPRRAANAYHSYAMLHAKSSKHPRQSIAKR